MRYQDLIEGMQENLAALVTCLLSLPAEEGSSHVFYKARSFIIRTSKTVFVAVDAESTVSVELDQAPCSISFRQADLYAIFYARYVPAFSAAM